MRQRDRQEQWRASTEGARWLESRGSLPICAIRELLLETLARADVVVVSGETGSGKT